PARRSVSTKTSPAKSSPTPNTKKKPTEKSKGTSLPGSPRVAEKAARATQREETFPVVAIGASAGGLEAMTELLANLPRKTGMAFISLQHSAPSRESLLTEILSRSSFIPLHEIKKGMKIEAEHGYVVPAGLTLGIMDRVFDLVAEPVYGRDTSIDRSFE